MLQDKGGLEPQIRGKMNSLLKHEEILNSSQILKSTVHDRGPWDRYCSLRLQDFNCCNGDTHRQQHGWDSEQSSGLSIRNI